MSLVFKDSEKKNVTFNTLPIDRFFVVKNTTSTFYKKLSADTYLRITMNPFNVLLISNGSNAFCSSILEEIEMCEATIYAKHLYKDS